MEDQIRQIMASVLGLKPDAIDDSTSRDTVAEWDSFNHLLLMNNLEKALGTAISISDIEKIRNYQDIKRHFLKKKTTVLFIKAPEIDFLPQKLKYNEVLSAPVPSIPLGIACLSAYLKQKGDYQVIIFDPHLEALETRSPAADAGIIQDVIREKIGSVRPDVVCISALMIINYKWVHFIADVSKKTDSSITVIVGGGYPTLLPDRALSDPNVDFIVIGEGEATLLEILEKRFDRTALQGTDGIGFKNADGSLTLRRRTTFITDLNSLPFMDWEGIGLSRYMKFYSPGFVSYITSRGCPFGCAFCSTYLLWGNKFRPYSAKRVLDELDYLVRNFGMRHIEFRDDNFTLNRNRTIEILTGIIDRNYNLTIEVPNGLAVTTLDEEILTLFKKAGCNVITFAVESGSTRVIRDIIHKPVSKDKVREMVKLARKTGLKIHTAFIIGFPGETRQEIDETRDFILELKCDWNQISIATPFPGTEMFRICEEKDYFTDPCCDLERYRYGFANIRTPEFDEAWLKQKAYDINIEVNFLKNPNLSTDPSQAVTEFEYVVSRYPKHVIALFCLSHAYSLLKNQSRSAEILERILEIRTRETEIFDTYRRYLDPSNPIFGDYFARCG